MTAVPTPPPGPATDAGGNTVLDPTKNVEKMVEAMKERQDDLREMESAHVREIVDIHSTYGEKLRMAETGRVDAIRQVDQGALLRQAEVQATREATLAANVVESATAMRVQVEAAAKAAGDTLAKSLEPIQKDIQDLRRVQYEGVGSKTQIVETQAQGASAGLWIGLGLTVLLLFLTLIGLGITLIASSHP